MNLLTIDSLFPNTNNIHISTLFTNDKDTCHCKMQEGALTVKVIEINFTLSKRNMIIFIRYINKKSQLIIA